MDNDISAAKEAERNRLIARMRRKANSILYIGVSTGLIIVGSVLTGHPIPPAILILVLLALAAFLIFQMATAYSLGKAARRLHQQSATDDSKE